MQRLLTAAVTTLFLCLPAFGVETVAGLDEQYSALKVGPSSAMRAQTFDSGHMKITLSDGAAAPVMAGSEVIGLYFKGAGSFEYVSADPAEAAVAATNIRRATKLKSEKTDKGLVIRDNFDEVFLWVAGRDFPKPAGGGGAALEQAFAAHRETFGRDRDSEAAFLFIQQKIDAPTTPVVRAEFKGGTETMVYVYDPVVARAEKLYSLHKTQTTVREYQQALWPVLLSEQLIGHTRKQFVEPNYLLFDLNYTLVASEKNDATLDVTETIIPRNRARRVFRFYQYDTVYDNNNRARRYTVRSVKDESGKDVPFVHRRNELLVGLPEAAAANTPFKLKFDIAGDFLIRPSGDSYWELGTEPWFPQPELNGQYYTIHSTVKVKKPYIAFAPGETVRRVEEGDYNVVENKIDKPVQFAVVLAGRYFYEEETQNGLTIRVASYAGKNTRAMKQLTNLAFKMIEFYEPFLGPFPFKEFNILEINQFGYGQAPPATMFITKEAFNPIGAEMNQIFSQGINHRFAHEIAHQYWGHVVKMGSVEEQWVTESFAEYSSSFVVKQLKGKAQYKAMENRWKANANEAKAESSIAMANRLSDPGNDFDAFIDRTHLVYDKGAYVLAMLHKEIGDDMFLSFLRNYQARYAWKFATTQDMISLLQQLTKKDFTEFFEKNFWGTEMPQG
ncbi:MAG TPA: M1 family aminopeptidase [Thermoanaerobaculia bacterium]|nr:M1 family aminopeptidase [Thermoanaerobaculia bacterium]